MTEEKASTLAIAPRQVHDEGCWVEIRIDYVGGDWARSRVPANIARKIAAKLLDVADEVDEINGALDGG